MVTMGEVLKNTNWPLLREQKAYLFELTERMENDDMDTEMLEGLLNFLDAIQDAAVEDGIATEAEVFEKKLAKTVIS